jgi:hypothetical protein
MSSCDTCNCQGIRRKTFVYTTKHSGNFHLKKESEFNVLNYTERIRQEENTLKSLRTLKHHDDICAKYLKQYM